MGFSEWLLDNARYSNAVDNPTNGPEDVMRVKDQLMNDYENRMAMRDAAYTNPNRRVPEVKAHNKAAKNKVLTPSEDGLFYGFGAEDGNTTKAYNYNGIQGESRSQQRNQYVPETVVAAHQERTQGKTNSDVFGGGPTKRLAGPVGKLPAISGAIGAAGGVSSVIGAKDLLDQVYQTKDPVAAYRNWLGMGNQYE